MSKKEIRGLVPTLRFPEFAGEWEENLFESIFSFKTTNSFSRDKLNYKKGTVKNIHYGDIHTKFNTWFNIKTETVPFINQSEFLEVIKQESYCMEGDIIFADASEDLEDIGKCIEIVNLNNEMLLSGLHTLLARQKSKKIIVGFGGYLFKSKKIRKQIQKESQGTKVLGISARRLNNIKVCFPFNKNEQQKIADCLSSLDERISAETQELDTLKKHKKGLMQQLFPAENKTVPALRFPEFEGEWEEKVLRDMLDSVVDNRGKTPPIIRESGIPLIEVNALGSKHIDYRKVSKFLTTETFDNFFRNYLKNGDILFTTVGQTANCSIYFDNVKTAIAQNIIGLRFASEDFRFMFYLLTEMRNNHKFKRIEMGAVQPSVKVTQMINIKLSLPSFPEQQKIADCLSSIDELITTQTQKIDVLKTHKKGLMQQLFPVEEETI